MKTFDKVYNLVSQIPKGKVTTYKAISQAVGINPIIVGYALHANNHPEYIPCHRVINSKGKISNGYAFGGPDVQKEMLKKEGVKFDRKERVDLKDFGYFLFL